MILPVMPTTVFILCAGWCFARSSERFHHWLYHHRYLGPSLRAWHAGEGIGRQVRNRATVTLWICMLVSIMVVSNLWVTLILLAIGAAVTTYLWRLPLLSEANSEQPADQTGPLTSRRYSPHWHKPA